MTLRNTQDNFGVIAKGLHWVIALLILGMIMVGFYMIQLENSPDKAQIFFLHKSFGLMVLWLAGLRLLWRFWSMPPDEMESHALWERILARLAHVFLYLAMLGMPLSGWLMSSAAEYPVPFFGLEMPDLVGKDESLATLMRTVHEFLAYGLVFVIGLHAAGALKHHFLDSDGTLRRMAGDKASLLAPVLLLLLAAFFSTVGWLVFSPEAGEDVQAVQAEKEVRTLQLTDLAVETPRALERGEWGIVRNKSKLGFEGMLYGSNFTGEFKKFDGIIKFDPERLPDSRVDIVIDMKSVDTGNKERDEQVITPEWFNTALFSEARFESLQFERGAGNQYVAVGYLTIRNVTLPVTLPFTLDITQKSNGDKVAQMNGTLELNRLDFGIGQGEWQSTETVADPVKVNISLTAEQPANNQ